MEGHQRAIGQALRALRKSRAFSQEDAAHAVGVSVSTWGDWERGKHNPYDSNWRKIEQAFGIDAAEIRGEPATPVFGVGSETSGRGGDLGQIRRELTEIREGITRIEKALAEVKSPAAEDSPTGVEEIDRSPRLGDLGSKRRGGPKDRRGTGRA